ncbi:MAG TPA: LPS export ABC transporter periplasmic protein LptC [Membranihabitans sp.]|nr:LPS export ABC transporter periplasmic protein LptC [Membranihabitans sp.]
MGKRRTMRNIWILWGMGILLLLTACDDKLPVAQDIEVDKLTTDADLAYNVTMEYTDDAQRLMTLEAPVLMRKNTLPLKDIFPDGILVTFYENAETFATLVSDYAERLPDDYMVIASGNVVFENIKGEKLETSELRWDERKGKIFTDRFARLTRPDEIIYGYGFTANQDFTEIEFEKTTGKRPVPQLNIQP